VASSAANETSFFIVRAPFSEKHICIAAEKSWPATCDIFSFQHITLMVVDGSL
jgi:hypothetical protein